MLNKIYLFKQLIFCKSIPLNQPNSSLPVEWQIDILWAQSKMNFDPAVDPAVVVIGRNPQISISISAQAQC